MLFECTSALLKWPVVEFFNNETVKAKNLDMVYNSKIFSDPQNRGKLISFAIAFFLVIMTSFFVNENEKEMERISGKIAAIDKNMEAGLSNYLLARSSFSQAMLYNTLGMMHRENGHSFSSLFIPFKDAVINGIKSVNESMIDAKSRLNNEEIRSIAYAFDKVAVENDTEGFANVFMETQVIIQTLNMAYETSLSKQANYKLELKNKLATLEVKASLLTWIAAIIGFVQLFFNSFYDMYVEQKKIKISSR